MKQVLLYLPVVHAGHEAFFARHGDAAEVLVLGAGFRGLFKSLAKDIRALPPEQAAQFLRVMLPGTPVRVIEPGDLPAAVTAETLVLPDEDITRNLAAEHRLGEGRELVFDQTFLRWDREWSQARRPADFDGTLAVDELPDRLVEQAKELAGHSSDWWRQVGAIAWRGGEILGAAWNHHRPTEYAPYIDGDPRDGFSRGVRADLSTAIHAEASVVAQAARAGRAPQRRGHLRHDVPLPGVRPSHRGVRLPPLLLHRRLLGPRGRPHPARGGRRVVLGGRAPC